MGVDVDLSQYCDVILLWNAVAMFLISFCSDYWEYRGYDYAELIPALQKMNNTHVRNYDQTHPTGVVVEFCAENSKNCSRDADVVNENVQLNRVPLYSEYGNLFKECNDLEESLRAQMYEDGEIYATPCYYFMFANGSRRQFNDNYGVYTTETLSFVFGCASAFLCMTALLNGTLGAIKNHPKLMTAAGVCLAGQGVFYSFTVVLFAIKMQFVQSFFLSKKTEFPQEILINRHKRFTLGWSYAAAVFSLVLTAVSTYVYLANSKAIRRRRARIVRRQRLEAALMSSCKQDVALALRAKMIVVTPENDSNHAEMW